jgi:hypothetical protein
METKQTRYQQDAPGSPQTVVRLRRANGDTAEVYVVVGINGGTFRVVLDDKHRKIRTGETLERAVRRFKRAQTERIWPKSEYPGYEIV